MITIAARDRWAACLAKEAETGTGNPDPTITKGTGSSPKGENMPPRGGEDISPAEGGRSPADAQKKSEPEKR